jgi:uncharacterized protein DUF11
MFRGLEQVKLGLPVMLLLMAMLAASGAGASRVQAAGDVGVSLIHNLEQQSATVGAPFSVRVQVGNTGPGDARAGFFVTVPAGIEIVGGTLGCPSGTGTVDCGDEDVPAGSDGDIGTVSLVANAAGSYTIGAALQRLTVSDPNPANNAASLTVTVAPRTVVLRATSLAVPARPKAGRPLRASFVLVENGAPTRPGSVSCRGRVAGKTVPAKGTVAGNRAVCTFIPPAKARGGILRGTITAAAGGKRVAKTFSVRLA